MNHKVTCKHCGRYLFTAKGTVILEQFPCPNTRCKAKLNIKIVHSGSSKEQINYKFSIEEVAPKKEVKHG